MIESISSVDKHILLSDPYYDKQHKYWKEQLTGCNYHLPMAIRKSEGGSLSLATIQIDVSEEVSKRLLKICSNNNLLIYIYALTALKCVFYRYFNQEDITIVSPVNAMLENEHTINDLVHIRSSLFAKKSFRETLVLVKENTFHAYENQDFPWGDIEIADSQGSLESLLSNVLVQFVGLHSIQQPQQEGMLTISLSAENDLLSGNVQFNEAIYDRASVLRLVRHFVNYLEKVVIKSDVSIDSVDYLSDEEVRQILKYSNTNLSSPSLLNLVGLFEAQVIKTPDGMALLFEGQSITYRELDIKANNIACELEKFHIQKGTIVPICLPRSIEMISVMLGVMKIGAAYLPIDVNLPKDRIDYMLSSIEVAAIVTNSETASHFSQVDLLLVDKIAENQSTYRTKCSHADLAYVIFTSGSTGRPKGVMVNQGAISNSIEWRRDYYKLNENDRVLQLFNFSFDGFLTSLFTPLVSGSAAILIKEENSRDVEAILSSIKKNKVTHFISVPSLFRELVEANEDELSSVQSVTLAGENVRQAFLEKCKAKVPHIKFFNEYGPTENAVVASCYPIDQTNSGGVIGFPINGTSIFILDENEKLLPLEIPGEIYLAGNSLSTGYIGNPTLTDASFKKININGSEIQCYKTGDVGKWDSDGRLHFIGRKDNQVKVNGFRIELSEIENVLLSHSEVSGAAVIVKSLNEKTQILKAFVESERPNVSVDLRAHLSKVLPYYMLPASIHRIEKLPLTFNGKINYQKLIEFISEESNIPEYESPLNQQEESLAEIFQYVLKADQVGRNDNFFALGGDSIKGIQVMSKARSLGYILGLKELFTYPTVASLTEFLNSSEKPVSEVFKVGTTTYCSSTEQTIISSLYKDNVEDIYALSPLQEGILFQTLSAPESRAYSVESSFDVQGHLDATMVQHAIDLMVDKYDILRTNFVYEQLDRPLQVVQRKRKITVQVVEVPGKSNDVSESEWIEKFEEENRSNAFDLAFDSLLRLSIIKIGENRNKFQWSFHHIIMDGWCFNILANEFFYIYRSLLSNKHPKFSSSTPYRTYIDWIGSQDKDEGSKYWNKYLAGYEELASIPHKSGASGLNASPYAQQYQRINDADSTRLRKLASKFGVTLNSLIHTIWGVLLSRYCGNKDVVFGTVSMGRPHEIKDVEKMVGLFINTLPLRIRFDNETLFSELSRFVQSDLVMQESKSYVSLADIQREHPLSGLLFDHILIFNYPLGNDSDKDNYNDGILEKLNFSISNLSSRERTNYGLNVTVSAAQEIVFKFSYDTSMYDEVFIQAIGKHIQYIVEQVLEREAIKLGEIKIVTDYERKGIVSTLRGYDDTSIIKETFLSQIERNVIDHPHQTAIVYNGRVITYQELNGKANALAKELIALGTKPGSLVAVVINRSLELPVSLLAVLKSGAAFIPIDSHWPLNRIKEILENVSENIAIVNDAALGRQLEHKNVLHVDFDKLSIETVNPSVQVELTDPIYCIFTSGSTGKPKGVINKHIGIINRFLYMDKRYKPVDTDVVLLTSNHTFDSAVWQLFWPLKNGIKVIIPGDSQLLDLEEIIQLIDKYQVTISDFVPSVFNVLVQWMEERPDYRAKLESLRQLLIGGEAMNAKHIYQFKSYFKNISITNTYGPTEASIGTIFFEVPTEYTEPIPIGRPIDNVHVLLLDRDGDLVPKGVAGEIYLGGLCTGQGYLNDLEKTNQVFVYAPVKEYSNEVFYRTGDRARLLPNGDIEFIGRIDNQLKVRGVRIELGEIESKILLHPDVHEVVVLHEVSGLKTELEAFVVGKEDFDVRALREFLLQYLPEVMIPSKFSLIEKIPISTNGKVDRRALRLLSSKIVDEQKNQTEGTELEMKIAAVWKEVLSINSAGLDDHFFELGGNSIDILRLHSKLKKEINFTESLVRLIQYPTIRSLANFLLKGLVENTTPDAQVKSRNKRKNDHRQRRKKVHEIQHEQYEIHGSNYVERIKNRTKYLSLDVEDEAIQKIMHQLKFNNNSVLIDAGCGTGDRLRTLLDKVPSILNDFPVRYGIDFSSTMIEQAGHKTIGENQLYDELLLDDLTSMSNSLQGDLVLCLWCIINECLDKYPLVLKNLSAMVKPGGYLIFDITTIKASEGYSKFDSVTRALHPEYDADSNDTLYLIKREDATLFYLKLFSKEEINQFEKILEMELCTLSGYGHLNSQLDQLPIDAKTNKNIDFAKEYSGLVLCFRKPLH